ncbi:MAG: spore germination protein [Firmicutes bacterium]|nr:spore germination protein [Bacillota bacterium]
MQRVSRKLGENTEYFKRRFENCGDVVSRVFAAGTGRKVYVAYIDDLADREMLERQVIRGLMVDTRDGDIAPSPQRLLESALITADVKEQEYLENCVDEILAGNAVVIVDGLCTAAVVSAKKVPGRGVNKPDTEISVQGPQDAFTESLRTNTVLIRRRIRSSNLKCVQMKLGKKTQTDTAVMYIEGTADENVVKSVLARLEKTAAEGILDSGCVEQYLKKGEKTLFPLVQLTERPDKTAAGLIEGRVAVVCDNSPFVILAPAVLFSFYQASEDYYQQWQTASFMRLIRLAAGLAAFTLPGLYVAVTMYDPSMLPAELSLHLAGARTGVPVSAMTEVTVLELAFETLREAGVRMPAAVGGTLGVVGGIIIGQAAVDAGLVSPMVVIVTAVTGICAFSIPSQQLTAAYRVIKFGVIIASAVLGIYGFILAVICVFVHLTSLESFGLPYIYPLGKKSALKDTFLRLPIEKQDGGEPVFAKNKTGGA